MTPMHVLSLRQVLVALGAIAFLVFVYFQLQSANPERNYYIGIHLQQLKQLDALLNQNILKIKVGTLRNYDPLVETVSQLRTLLDHLREGPIAIYGTTGSRVDEAYDAYSKLLDKRVSILERFKSNYAILKNSRSYFPVVVAELAASGTKRGEDGGLAIALNERQLGS